MSIDSAITTMKVRVLHSIPTCYPATQIPPSELQYEARTLLDLPPFPLAPPIGQTIEDGKDDKNEHCRCEHPTNDDTCKGLLCLGTDAGRHRSRNQSDGCGQRCHEDGTHADFCAFQNGGANVESFLQMVLDTTHQNQSSLNRYTEQKNEPNRNGNAEVRARQEQGQDTPYKRKGHSDQHDQRITDRIENQIDKEQDQDQRNGNNFG